MREILKSGSVRGVKLFYKAEYCGTPQSKERSNREYKVCLNERVSRLLDGFSGKNGAVFGCASCTAECVSGWLVGAVQKALTDSNPSHLNSSCR
jgi:hypothetical protein